MNDGTIVIQPYMIYAAIATVCTAFIAATMPWIVKNVKRRRAAKECQAKIDKNYATQREHIRLAELYPQPWLDTYQDCKKLRWQDRIILFNAWIGQAGQLERLPKLSMEGIRELATIVSMPNNYARVIEKLTPYLALKNESHRAFYLGGNQCASLTNQIALPNSEPEKQP